jgi:putative peptidoglycan lipid II flippase
LNRAVLVAGGIMISRVAGFVRMRTFAHYFGLRSDAADAFNAAFRMPNLLQALLGEGALSASFIPVYASLLARGERRDADRVAGAVLSLSATIVAVGVLLAVLATPALVALIAPGFTGEKRALTITIARILFPGVGMAVLSAWCLGILNSHHRFTLSYAAPVLWNAAMITTLLVFGPRESLPRLAVVLAWGSVVGSALQFAAQLPVVLRLAPDIRLAYDLASAHVRAVGRSFLPAAISRGVVQLSAYVDSMIASLLPTGAVTGMANAQLLYTLPVSLFGISVAASELPAMAGAMGASGEEAVRARLEAGLKRIAYFTVPSAVAFLALGDVVAGAVLQTGRFTSADARYVWAILAGSSIGLVSSTLARLYASTYFALRDARTPLRFALARVALSTAMGFTFATYGPSWVGVDARWGAAGLTAATGLAGWVEMYLLRQSLARRIGGAAPRVAHLARLWGAAAAAALAAWGVKLVLPPLHPALVGGLVLGTYGAGYFGGTLAMAVPDALAVLRRLRRR